MEPLWPSTTSLKKEKMVFWAYPMQHSRRTIWAYVPLCAGSVRPRVLFYPILCAVSKNIGKQHSVFSQFSAYVLPSWPPIEPISMLALCELQSEPVESIWFLRLSKNHGKTYDSRVTTPPELKLLAACSRCHHTKKNRSMSSCLDNFFSAYKHVA